MLFYQMTFKVKNNVISSYLDKRKRFKLSSFYLNEIHKIIRFEKQNGTFPNTSLFGLNASTATCYLQATT